MKRVRVHHEFDIPDDVPEEHLGYMIGTMTVQVEEPVVGEDENGNEVNIEVGDRIEVTHTVTPLTGWEDEEYVDELAPYTPLLDLLAASPVTIHDFNVVEMGNLLLLTVDDEHNLTLGIADFTDEHWTVVAYGGEREHEWIDRTDVIGKVLVDGGEASQIELGRRIVWYLQSLQWERDYESLTIYHHTAEPEQRALCGTTDVNAMTMGGPDGVNCGGCLDRLGLG